MLLPIFFPQPVLGLALLLWFNALGIQTVLARPRSFAHLVWIVPVVTLVMAIQVYGFDPALEEAAFDLGASRLQVLREVTLPILWPGIWSGALFAFLLSWGNFPLSLYTTGADSTVPEWLYAKMVAGYTPMVPALGTMSTLAAAAAPARRGPRAAPAPPAGSAMTANRWRPLRRLGRAPAAPRQVRPGGPGARLRGDVEPVRPAARRRDRGRPRRR